MVIKKEKKRNPLKLKEFRGVNLEHIRSLGEIGIRNVDQMLSAGRTADQRLLLSQRTGIPVDGLLELAKLSDLARLPGVKGIRARLYYDAGVTDVEKLASWDADQLLVFMAEFVSKSGFEGIPPLPKEVSSTIANARNLPILLKD